MNVSFLFLGGLIGYILMASLPFTSLVHRGAVFYTLGIVMGAGLNSLWLTIARNLEPQEIILYGVMWDAMLTLTYVLVPVLLWGQPTNWKLWVGVALILIGMLVAKMP